MGDRRARAASSAFDDQHTLRAASDRLRYPAAAAYTYDPIFTKLFPYQLNRDPSYEHARSHPALTWQKYWWRMSGGIWGLFLKEVCRAWSCDIESLVAPLAERRWSDTDHLPDASLGTIFGMRFNRPR